MASDLIDVELLRAYRIQLAVLNDELNKHENAEPKDEKITHLLETSDKHGWFNLYEAEQRLVALMTDQQITACALRRFEEAKKLQVKSAPALEREFEKAGTTTLERRAMFADLLDDIHFRYTKRRIDREQRARTAFVFYIAGIVILLPLLAFLFVPHFKDYLIVIYGAPLHIVAALYFGVLGAFFSRIIAFQKSLPNLDYDILVRDYSGWVLVIRLLTGLIGALLMYMLINSRLAQGTLFPNTSDVSLWRTVAGGKPLPLPNFEFSKLIIWSVIAGFSERLIPAQLVRIEGTSKEKPAT